MRWNSAFAYLDPVRSRPELRILDRTLVERVLIEGGRAVGVAALGADGELRIRAQHVVLSAGAYHSPAILMRSGIGPADHLLALGVKPMLDRPGVGSNLTDHPVVPLRYLATEHGVVAARQLVSSILPPRSQLEIRACSGLTSAATDVHYSFPAGTAVPDGWEFTVRVEVFKPASRGSVRLSSRDPAERPWIDGHYFSDADGHDLGVMEFGVALARQIVGAGAMQSVVAHERWPGAGVAGDALRRFAQANAYTFHHPAGTCRMGLPDDPMAVVDGAGHVHGVEGLSVADASIMPELPAAVPNLTCMAIGEIIAGRFGRSSGSGSASTMRGGQPQ
jgi:choline dehydrogenase